MKIIAIVVTYNGMKWYKKCFDSLKHSSIPVTTIVIDNKSSDETTSFIKENYPEIILIESSKNLGFGKANNIGLKYALEQNADYVFLLNQDAWVKPDTIEKLTAQMQENPEYGILSPIHLIGSENRLDYNFNQYISCIEYPNIVSDILIKGKPSDGIYPVKFVNAALWLMSRQCLKKVGGFNPIFPHYGEDNDYVHRLGVHILKIGIYPYAFAIHDRIQYEAEKTYKQKKSRNLITHLLSLCNISVIYRRCLYWTMYNLTLETIGNCMRFRLKNLTINIYTLIKLICLMPQIVKNRKIAQKTGTSFLS